MNKVCALLLAMLPVAVQADITGLDLSSVRQCWNIDATTAAARTVIAVQFDLLPDGRVNGDIRLVTTNGNDTETATAFLSARRAILRCQGSDGYDLPVDRYDEWKVVEMIFDPTALDQ